MSSTKGITATVILAVLSSTLVQLVFGNLDNFDIQYQQEDDDIRILVLGKLGHGKSSFGNLILGRELFKTGNSYFPVTEETSMASADVGGRFISVVDTPQMNAIDKNYPEDFKYFASAIAHSPKGYHVFVLVFSVVTRITQDEKQAILSLQRLLGDGFFRHVMIVFTHKDEFSGTINDFRKQLNKEPNVKGIVSLAEHRFVLVDNTCRCPSQKRRDFQTQVIEMVDQIMFRNDYLPFDNHLFREARETMHGYSKKGRNWFEQLIIIALSIIVTNVSHYAWSVLSSSVRFIASVLGIPIL